VLQCVAVCCSLLQRVAVHCSVLQCVVVCFSNMLQCAAVCCEDSFIAARGLGPVFACENVEMRINMNNKKDEFVNMTHSCARSEALLVNWA